MLSKYKEIRDAAWRQDSHCGRETRSRSVVFGEPGVSLVLACEEAENREWATSNVEGKRMDSQMPLATQYNTILK